MKLNKTLKFVLAITILLVIIILGYFLIRYKYIKEKPLKREEVLNLNVEKVVKDPAEEDILNLINKLKNKNKSL
jgi:hypothetical protein